MNRFHEFVAKLFRTPYRFALWISLFLHTSIFIFSPTSQAPLKPHPLNPKITSVTIIEGPNIKSTFNQSHQKSPTAKKLDRKQSNKTTPVKKRYSDFLPTTAFSDEEFPGVAHNKERVTTGRLEQITPITRDQNEPLALAKEFAHYLHPPLSLIKIKPNGSAIAVIKKNGEGIRVESVNGHDGYYRSFLLEEIQRIGPKHYISILLHKLERDYLKVHFSYKTVSISDLTFKEVSWFADADSVTVIKSQQKDPQYLSLLAPASATAIGANPIAAGLLLYKAIKSECLECDDVTLKRLRQSPAFSREFNQ